MTPLYYIVSVVLVGFHSLFSLVLPKDGGAAWVLSIIGLTLVIRAALIPLFVKQIKSSRNMQLLQPKVRELQKKYGHDRERLAQETMNLYKDAGTNPFASCLPILVQMPIFLALFRMLDQASRNGEGRGVLSDELASQFGRAEIFGVVPISETFWENATGGGSIAVIIVAIVLVLAMTGTTFMTQRQLMAKNMPAEALSGPYAQQQKMLLYVLPLVFGISGVAFPIGVLIYWTVSNLWTMGQQFYVIRNNPAPGTPAEKAKQERDAAKEARRRARRGEPEPVATEVVEVQPESSTKPSARQQPKRKTRSQRKKS
ncbi:membrane protein insertase YidC [Nocardioides jishulii]